MTRACFLLHDFLIDAAARDAEAIALVCDGNRFTYRELDERSNGLACTLAAHGVERGDRVLVFADNCVETVIAFWATLKANAVVSIVHTQTKAAKLRYLIDDCRPRAIVTHTAQLGVVVSALRGSPHVASVIVAGELDDRVRSAMCELPRALAWHDAATRASEPPSRRCLDVDLAAIIYTSGSTGEPKGVMLTHHNMVAACRSISEYLGVQRDEVILCALPLAFDYGLYQVIMAFAAGARVVLERSFAYPTQILTQIAQERVTGFPGVPTMFATLLALDSLARYDLSSLRYVTNTAAALPVKHLLALRDLFPSARVFSMYGLTECKRCTYLPPDDITRKPDSVGIAIPNTELWIVDEHGQRVPPNQIGELVIRGATVMKGYWEKPEATARKLRPGPLPGEQVLHTGDLCRLDDEGYLYFVGRMDEVIKSRGEKVAPKEVEASILAIPGVREAAVIGVPDEILGNAIKAFVVLEPGAVLDARTIQRECRSRLESFMVPTYVEVRDALPRSANGKIHKSALC